MQESDSNGYVFFVTQIGSEGTPQRQRSDDVLSGVVTPVAEEYGMLTIRGDKVSTPGQVGTQIIKDMMGARMIVADLFGRNPNAYYELGIAHAMRLPTVVIVDRLDSLAFDTVSERVIAIGDDGTKIGISEAEKAKEKLRGFFRTVLADGYVVENLVTSAGVELSVDGLSDNGNAIATEVAALRDSIDELRASFSKGFTFNMQTHITPNFVEDVLPKLKPMARALLSGGVFRTAGYGKGIVEFPNPTYAKRCELYTAEVEAALSRVAGVPYTITFETSPDYVPSVTATKS